MQMRRNFFSPRVCLLVYLSKCFFFLFIGLKKVSLL